MADERNVAHDKKVAADKAKTEDGGLGKDSAANVDGDGQYTPETHKMFTGMIAWAVYHDTAKPNPGLLAQPARTVKVVGADAKETSPLAELPVDQSGFGNLEGKELRFGPSAGATFSAVTTAVTCGSVNSMHDSLNPLAGITPLVGMQLNCVFGGKGVGLINMMIYLVIGVFLAGLMVGRTPEYLGKKIEAREMKLAMLALLIHPIMVLGPTGLFAALDWGKVATNNPGPHGFSEILYEFSSASANNGSGFEGLGDTHGFNDPKKNLTAPATYSAEWDIDELLVASWIRQSSGQSGKDCF